MASVKNNYASPIALPDGTHIAVGGVADVPGWSDLKDHPIVKIWLDQGVIEASQANVDKIQSKADDDAAKAAAEQAAKEAEEAARTQAQVDAAKAAEGKQPVVDASANSSTGKTK